MAAAQIEAASLPEVKQIRDLARTAEVYAKAAHLSRETVNHAAEIKLLADRKAGELLKQLEKSKGGQHTHRAGDSVSPVESDYHRVLKDTDTSLRTAQRWRSPMLCEYCGENKGTHERAGYDVAPTDRGEERRWMREWVCDECDPTWRLGHVGQDTSRLQLLAANNYAEEKLATAEKQ